MISHFNQQQEQTEKVVMMKKDCTTCMYAEFEKYSSKTRDLNKGTCVAMLSLPNSFLDHRNEYPVRSGVSKYTKTGCAYWRRIVENPFALEK